MRNDRLVLIVHYIVLRSSLLFMCMHASGVPEREGIYAARLYPIYPSGGALLQPLCNFIVGALASTHPPAPFPLGRGLSKLEKDYGTPLGPRQGSAPAPPGTWYC